ncbi:MAG: hypothetical protein A2Y84_01310 [Candidatus Colwellbacteria bacterium RBG_13_48_8]|uniref:Uncharacterized protein n=1 Tax=Candidatus Colwellbacteria bacterium RBG_13_48_8 TaxID=1797685 RepID=A0A1G1YXT2_9BACT|nr:MAG: hypothetical protein A2Y84_01310 [Candidatus Colwellbacteria bacterium RBG_13_48_8]
MKVIPLPQKYLLPGKQRPLEIALAREGESLLAKIGNELYVGPFTANLTMMTPDDQLISYSVGFWVFPWKVWGVLIVGSAAVIFLFRKLRKRFLPALRALFRH